MSQLVIGTKGLPPCQSAEFKDRGEKGGGRGRNCANVTGLRERGEGGEGERTRPTIRKYERGEREKKERGKPRLCAKDGKGKEGRKQERGKQFFFYG